MARYLIRVTESINHDYLIEADSRDDALSIYASYTSEQLVELDTDGDSCWNSPWDVEELTTGGETA